MYFYISQERTCTLLASLHKEQIMTVYAVCRLLKAYPIHYIVGHSEITNRRLDPGAAFPLKQFRGTIIKDKQPLETDGPLRSSLSHRLGMVRVSLGVLSFQDRFNVVTPSFGNRNEAG